jgi:hypothetical protein
MAQVANPWAKGTINLLRGETDRVRQLAQSLEDLAGDIERADPPGWVGGARETYVEARRRQSGQVRRAAAAHELAAQALDRYVDVLTGLAGRRRYESDSGALAGLEHQRVEVATHASDVLREAAEQLQAVRPTLPELTDGVRPATVPGAEPVAAAGPAPAAAEQAPIRPAPLAATVDPRAIVDITVFCRRVQDLNDALHDHWSET